MARGVNKVIIVGTLGNDPDMKYTAGGNAIANISVATNEKWRDKNSGEMVEKTEWHRIVAFNKLAEIIGQYLRKGSQAYFEGKLQTRKWQDQNGQDRYTTEIVANDMRMLGGGQGAGAQGSAAPDQQRVPTQQQAPAPAAVPPGMDDGFDDIPF